MDVSNRLHLTRRTAAGLVLGAIAAPKAAMAQTKTLNLISHRYPALEYFAKTMEKAVPGYEVKASLMPKDRAVELATVNLSRGSDAYDIVWTDDSLLQKYAKNGWLEPLDDLWDRFRAEFNLSDYSDSTLDAMRFDGKLYAMPFDVNAQLLFYRADLFEAQGKKPPGTFPEYLRSAEAFNRPPVAGTSMGLKPVDSALNEIFYYVNAHGGSWFDKDWRPAFNSPAGLQAIQSMKAMTKFAQRGYTAAANDETAFTLQQGLAAMGIHWISRALSMDDPAKSSVAGKIAWAAAPGGGAKLAVSGYSISKFTKHDKDAVFRVIASAGTSDKLKGVAGLALPARLSVLDNPELQQKYRFYSAAGEAVKVNQTYPKLPEFDEAGEIIARRFLQAIAGETELQPALDSAAADVEKMLKSRGYFGK